MSFAEVLLIAIIGLVFIGPKRLPEAARFAGLWIGRLRRALSGAKAELEKELGLDDVRRQLHNEQILDDLEKKAKTGEQAKKTGDPPSE